MIIKCEAGIKMYKTRGILIFLIVFFSSIATAAQFDSGEDWKTIKTQHFRIHFPKHLEDIAQKSAAISEEVYSGLVERWSWKPWSYIEVVITDEADDSNGMATILPYNQIYLWVTPPKPDSPIAHTDDWLKMLISHELTHIIQLDGAEGFWRIPRMLLGKLIAPSGLNPRWLIEGIPQIEETRLTNAGRGRGSYSEMVVRASVVEDNFPKIDEADGINWRWPSGSGAYIYGLKFVDYLIEKYGEEKLHEMDKKVRRSPLLFAVSRQAKKVYGKNLPSLWKEWHEELKQKYSAMTKEMKSNDLTETNEVVEKKKDDQFSSPSISPDGLKLAYSISSPHHDSYIRIKDFETGEDEIVVKKKHVQQISWSPDGKRIAYSDTKRYKWYHDFNDIWIYDLEKKKQRRITKGLRARDPEFTSDGESLIFVLSDGFYDRIGIISSTEKNAKHLVMVDKPMTQFANPRFSSDGKKFAVSQHSVDDGWRIYVYNSDGSNPKRITNGKGVAIESYPSWGKGGAVFFSSDEDGIANIYSADLKKNNIKKLTNTLGGFFQPSTLDGENIYVRSYSSKGFGIGMVEIAKHEERDRIGTPLLFKAGLDPDASRGAGPDASRGAGQVEDGLRLASKNYSSIGRSLFLPRFVLPFVGYSNDAFFLGAATGSNDSLLRHLWYGGILYRTDANHLGYYFDYAYNRFRPVFTAGINEFAYGLGRLARTGDIYFEKYLTGYGAISVPFENFVASSGYYFSEHTNKTYLTSFEKPFFNLGRFAGIFFGLNYSDAKSYPASISSESGQRANLSLTVTDKALASSDENEQIVFVGDVRKYIKLFGHSVLALRLKGGMTWNDKIFQDTFVLGGAPGEGTMAANAGANYFSLRGTPYSFGSGERALLMSSEFRIPIKSVQRGIGTAPLYMRELHGALFADYGNVWSNTPDMEDFLDDFMLGVGLEFRANFVVGHALPIDGRLGYAILVVNRDRLGNVRDPITRNAAKYGVVILEFGTSF